MASRVKGPVPTYWVVSPFYLSGWGLVGAALLGSAAFQMLPRLLTETDPRARAVCVVFVVVELAIGPWLLRLAYRRFKGGAATLISQGIAADTKGSLQEARVCYEAALKISPDDRRAWNNKGVTLFKLGEFEQALQCFEKALPSRLAKANIGLVTDKMKSEGLTNP